MQLRCFLIAGVLLEMGIPQEEANPPDQGAACNAARLLELEAKRGFGMPVEIDESSEVAVDLVISAIEARAAR